MLHPNLTTERLIYMAAITKKIETNRTTDADGNIKETTKESTFKIERSNEPDYIKLYTNVWCEFNEIPLQWRPLFLELISRMTYCNSAKINESQLVYTGKPFSDFICDVLDIGNRQYQKGLKNLVECNAIKHIAKGVYQINPTYAGRGEWKYNPRFNRGGIEDLIATFNFKTGEVDTKFIWVDDGTDSDLNQMYRDGLNVSKSDATILKSRDFKLSKKQSDNDDNIDLIPELEGVI
jgi:hypothetical protein